MTNPTREGLADEQIATRLLQIGAIDRLVDGDSLGETRRHATEIVTFVRSAIETQTQATRAAPAANVGTIGHVGNGKTTLTAAIVSALTHPEPAQPMSAMREAELARLEDQYRDDPEPAQQATPPVDARLREAAIWLHAAYDRPPQTPEAIAMLARIDAALAQQATRADFESDSEWRAYCKGWAYARHL